MIRDTTPEGLRAAVRALEGVVRPAVDSANPLAVEQLQMVSRYIALVADRLAWRHARLRLQLRHLSNSAHALAECTPALPAPVATALASALAAADAVRAEPDTPEPELERAGNALSTALSAVVRASAVLDTATRTQIERSVLRAGDEWIDPQRAWFAPLGLDPGAEALPPPSETFKGRP